MFLLLYIMIYCGILCIFMFAEVLKIMRSSSCVFSIEFTVLSVRSMEWREYALDLQVPWHLKEKTR